MYSTTDKITAGMYGNGEVQIHGLTKESEGLLLGALSGANWIRVVAGKLDSVPSWKSGPDPISDPDMLPYWRKPTAGERKTGEVLIDTDMANFSEHSSPSLLVQHLCGYDYSPEAYQRNAERLQEYGFECLRSRRGPDGKYWEIWCLPGLWSAKGRLKDALGGKHSGAETVQKALRFMAQTVSFGTLDVSSQRLAMVID